MVEDPIKLFATRAERYPEPTDADVALGAGRAALAAIPFVGGSITEVLSLVLAPAVIRRRDTWFKELADGIDQLEARVQGLTVEFLQHKETFISAAIQATRAAAATHQREKREALRNAVLNAALTSSLDEDKQIMFLGLIEASSVTHLALLRFFSNRGSYSHDEAMTLINRRSVTDPMILELNSRGLLKDPRPYVSRNRDVEDSLVKQGWTLTALGMEFLGFISTPEPLK